MFSKRISNIQPFIVMELLERALEMEKSGIDVVHMEIGEPDFDTPSKIINGCIEGINQGKTHYTHSLGILELREKISDYKLRTRGTYFNPKNQIMVTSGTSPAFFNILSSILNDNDEVIITDPGYPCYTNFSNYFGGNPRFVEIYEEDEFNLRIDNLKEAITSKTKVIILNSPSNPTGQIITEESLEEISKIAAEKNIWIISDEIYAELTYDNNLAPSLSEDKYKICHNRLIVLDGFSKLYAMCGWRLGYILAPQELIAKMTPVQQNFSICAPSISQIAGLYAFDCKEETKKMMEIYTKRRNFIVDKLNEIEGISCLPPKGAFYAFANISKLGCDSITFSKRLLEEAHVAACPGISFGPNGDNYIRFSYPTNINNIEKGMNRLKKFVKNFN